MDRLAHLAQEHWAKNLSAAFASIVDRDAFFQEMADEAQSQIEALEEHLRGPDLPAEPFAARMARYQSARQRAEEIVINEVVLLPSEK